MLKKAGIIAATAVAGLVALTPLAFASDEVNVSGDQACGLEGAQANDVTGTQEAGLLALIGGIGAGVPVQAQLPIANCIDASRDDVTVEESEVSITDNVFKGGDDD